MKSPEGKERSLPCRVFVLHVRDGYEDRAVRIESMLGRQRIPFEYILSGDIADLSDDVLSANFKGPMRLAGAESSCAMKHLLAYRKIDDENLDGALILEDDISLSRNFKEIFLKCISEIKARGLDDILLSLEDTSFHFVPGSQRIRGQHIYKGPRDRYAGCYYISAGCARQILRYVDRNRCHLPIDRFHTFLLENDKLPYYWSHPTIATQGSKNGRFGSSISLRDFKRTAYLKISRPLKLFYKKLIYRFR